jgi:5'-methylthioinosine phosphorylase
MLAILGGSGLTEFDGLEQVRRRAMATPWGEPSGHLTFGRLSGQEMVFLARHGDGHTLPPHKINYRANVHALKDAGASQILSVATVGGIRDDFGPGKLVLPDQILDYTWGRASTFFEDRGTPVTHIDFTQPYDRALRTRIFEAAAACGEKMADRGVYATTQGPRLESAAEIDRLERDGADLVGMTGMPEAALAREAGLPYATIAVVVNHAAGRGASANGISLENLQAVLAEAMARVRKIIAKVAES